MHRFAETLDTLIQHTNDLVQEGFNVYVTPNSYGGHSRRSEVAVYSRSFFIDLDVGDSDKKYPSREAALIGIDTFLQATGLPPPVRINSGTGIQAYWAFDKDVEIGVWIPYAKLFQTYCIAAGLKIDTAVTSDAARLMRCPDTFNYKTDPPSPTSVLDEEIEQYDFDSFKELLGEPDAPILLSTILAEAPKGLDGDTSALAYKDNYEYVFSDIAIKSLEGRGCAQIKHILSYPESVPEPLWYAGLSVSVRCSDGDEAIHQMSEDHPSYSREKTIRKAQQSLANAKWAHSCSAFEKENPSGCEGCAFKGKLRSGSPIDLGRQFKEAEEAPTENSVRLEEDSETLQAFPNYLKPFVRGRKGGVYYVGAADENGEKPDPVCITQSDLYAVKRMKAGAEGYCLLLRHIQPKDPMAEFLMPLKYIYSFEKLKQILGENGVDFHVSLTQRMFEYLMRWDVYLKHKETADIMRMQLGWTEERDAFVAGSIEISPDGKERPAAASPIIKNVTKLVKRVGSYDVWKESANALNQPGFELHALGLLSGFGSPLMYLTGTPGCTVCFQSTDSGIGKSGALYAGLSVFADPYNISILDGAATENAHIGRYLGLKNIMFGIDEVSNIDAEVLSKLLHRISQGKAKLRMQQSTNAERDLELSASLLAVMTSNQSLYDKLFSHKGAPQGELARLIEFQMKKPPQMELDPTLGQKIFNPFRYNYGFAGPEYIKYLYKVGEAYQLKIINKWSNEFTKDYGGNTEYRFYMNYMASCFAGGELAGEAGIIKYDLENIYKVVVKDMIQIRDNTVKPANIDYRGVITEFYLQNIDRFLIFNEGSCISEPRGSLLGRIEIDSGKTYIMKSEMKKFISEKQISSREFEVFLKRDNALLGVEKKRLSSGWRAGTAAHPPINVYVFQSTLDILAKEQIHGD